LTVDRSDFRLPANPPTGSEVANQQAFTKLVDTQLADVQTSAGKWQAGLATFITLVSAGVVLKGPDKASDLTDSWRIVLTILAVAGLFMAVWGLWAALRASAGTPSVTSFDDVIEQYGSVGGLKAAAAVDAAEDIRVARSRTVLALLLIGAAVFASWWAKTETKSVKLSVTIADDHVVCGTLKSGDQQRLVISVDGASEDTVIPFTDVKNLKPVAECTSSTP
jgi:hypothetical protein